MSAPLISIIMPAYNAAKFIAEAINSVLSQNYTNIELVVVDDGSTDNTRDIIQSSNDPRIKLICRNQPSGGTSIPRNLAIQHATGELIGFMDADDLFESPDSLGQLAAYLQNNPDKFGVFGFYQKVDVHNNVLEDGMPPIAEDYAGKPYVHPRFVMDWPALLNSHCVYNPPCYLYRKQVFDDIGGFHELLKTAVDFEFVIRLHALRPNAVGIIPHYVLRYRVYPSSITKDPKRMQNYIKNGQILWQHIIHQLPLPPECDELKYQACANWYRSYAGLRLQYGQNATARQFIWAGLTNPDVKPRYWHRFVGMGVRSLLPKTLNHQISMLARQMRLRNWNQADEASGAMFFGG